MARHEVFSTDIVFNVKGIEEATKAIVEIRRAATGAVQDIAKVLKSFEGPVGPRGGLSTLGQIDAKKLRSDVREALRGAKLDAETLIKGDIERVISEVADQIGSDADSIIARLARIGDEGSKAFKELREGGDEEARKLYVALLGRSWITDIGEGAKRVFDKMSDDFKTSFGNMNATAQKESSTISDSFEEEITDLSQNVIPALIREVESEFRSLPNKSRASVLAIGEQLKGIKDDFRKFTTSKDTSQLDFNLSDIVSNLGKVKQSVSTVTDQDLEQLKSQLNSVREISDTSSKGILGNFRQIKEGISIATGEGGSRLLGLRTALFGIEDSSNILARVLDSKLTKSFEGATLAENKFAQAGKQAADRISTLTNQLEVQADIFSKLAGRTGTDTSRLNALRSSLTEVENAAEKAGRSLARGGDATGQIIELNDTANRLRENIEAIRAQDILDDEAERELKVLEQQLTNIEKSAQILTTRQRQLKASVDQAKQAEKEQGEQTERTRRSFVDWLKSLVTFNRNQEESERAVERTTTEIRQYDRAVDQASASTSSFRSIFAGTFLGATAGTFLGNMAFRLREVSGEVVKLGADAEELQNRFSVVFDEESGLADQVEAVLGEMATSFRRNVTDLKDISSDFQDTFVPLGFAREDAAQMSVALTALTQDLSSFYNVSTEEAAERLSSTLVGNTENMRAFGVQINDAAIQQEYLNLGLDVTSRTASVQQKAMAILSLSMKGVTDAMGDLQRSGDEFTNTGRALDSTIDSIKERIGSRLLPLLAPFLRILSRLAEEVAPSVIDFFDRMTASIEPFATALANALSGQGVEELTVRFQEILSRGIEGAMNILNSFIVGAFNWGVSFISEIASGMWEAFGQIVEAVTAVGEIIASFLAPGSPPEQGPLSDIDKWADGLIDTFASSFTAADFRFVKDALQPIKQQFLEVGGEAGFFGFQGVRDQLVAVTEELNRTGKINETLFQGISDSLGEGNEKLTQWLKLNLELQKARQNLKKVEDEIAVAQKAGFVSSELKKRLESAKEEVEQAQENVDLQKEFLDFQSLSIDEFNKNQLAAAKNAATGAVKAAKNAVDKQLQFVQEGYKEERRLLDEKLALGAISQEEYLRELIKLEEKYIDASQRQGMLSGIDQHILDLQKAQEELGALKESAKKAAKETKAPGEIGQNLIDTILGDYLQESGAIQGNLKSKLEGSGKRVASIVVESVKSAFQEEAPRVARTLIDSLVDGFSRLGSEIKASFSGERGVFVQGISALLGGLATTKIIAGVTTLATKLAPLIARFGGLLGIAGRLVGIGAILVVVFQNWDSIVLAFNSTVAFARDEWNKFLEAFGGKEEFFTQVQGAIDSFNYTMSILGERLSNIFDADLGQELAGKMGQLVNTILQGDFSNIPEKIKEVWLAVPFADIVGSFDLSTLPIGGITTFAANLYNTILSEAKRIIVSVIGDETLSGIQGTLSSVKDSIAEIFSQGEIGDEFKRLFIALKDVFIELLPVVRVVAITIGVVLLSALDIVVSAIQGLVDALPFVIDAFSGVVTVIRGAIETIDGLITIIVGLVQLIITAFKGGDVSGALDTLKEGFSETFGGIATIQSGLVQTITSTLSAIGVFITSFITNLITNVTKFFGEDMKAFTESVINIKDTIIGFFDGVNQFGIDFKNTISDILQGDFGSLEPVKTFFSNLGDSIKEPIGAAINTAIETVKGIGTSILTSFLPIPGLLKPIVATLVSFIPLDFETIKSSVQEKMDALNEYLGNLNFFGGTLKSHLDNGVTIFKTTFDKIKNTVLNTLLSIGLSLATAINSITKKLSDISLFSDFDKTIEERKIAITRSIYGLLVSTREFLDPIGKKFTEIFDGIISYLSELDLFSVFLLTLGTNKESISTSIEAIKTVIETTVETLKENVGAIFQEISNFFSGIGIFGDTDEELDTSGGNLVNRITTLKDDSLARLTELKDGAKERFDALSLSISEADFTGGSLTDLETLKTNALTKLDELGSGAKTSITEFRTNVEEDFNSLKENLDQLGVLDGATDKIEAAKNRAIEIFRALKDEGPGIVSEAVTAISSTISSVFAPIGDLNIGSLTDLIKSEDITGVFETAKTELEPILTSLQTFVSTTFSEISASLTESFIEQATVDSILSTIQSVIDKLSELATGVSEHLTIAKETVDTILTEISTIINTLSLTVYDNLVKPFKDASTDLVGDPLAVVNTMGSGIVLVLSEIARLIKDEVFSGIKDVVVGIFSSLGIEAVAEVAKLEVSIPEAVGLLKDNFIAKFTETRDGALGALSGIITKFTAISQTWPAIFDTLLSTSYDTIVGMFDSAKQYIIDLFNSLPSLATEGGELFNAIAEMGENIITALETLPTKIVGLKDKFLEAGKAWVRELLAGFTGPLEALGLIDALEEDIDEIPEATREATEETGGLWAGLHDLLTKNSIIPDMMNEIKLEFTNLNPPVISTTGQLTSFLIASYESIWQAWLNMTTLNQEQWTVFVDYVREKWRQFTEFFKEAVGQMIAVVNRLIEAILGIVEAAEKAIEALEALADIDLDDLVGAMERMEDAMEKTRKFARDLRDFLEAAKDHARAIGDELGSGPGGGGGFQSGLYRVPRTMSAVLHRGETVLPAKAAGAFRSLIEILDSVGIGNSAFSLGNVLTSSNTQKAASIGQITNHTYNIEAVFPNVSNKRDADGIKRRLDELIQQGNAFGKVGA